MRFQISTDQWIDLGELSLIVETTEGKDTEAVFFQYTPEERKELAGWLLKYSHSASAKFQLPTLFMGQIDSPWDVTDTEYTGFEIKGTDPDDQRYVFISIDAITAGNLGRSMLKLSFTPDEYQRLTATTAIYHGLPIPPLAYLGLKIAGESGEVSEKLGKIYRDSDGQIDEEALVLLEKELGDVCWYVARIAAELGVPLSQVMQNNILKLQDRLLRGVLHGNGDTR